MISCPNCNKKLKNGAKFCNGCGTQIPEPVNVEPSVVDEPAVAGKKKLPKKFFIFGGIGVAVIAVIILVVCLITGNDTAKQNYALYVKDSEIFFADFSTSKVNPWQVTTKLVESGDVDNEDIAEYSYDIASCSYFSKDGSLLFYPDKIDDGFGLYYRNIKNSKSEPKKIDSDVDSYYVNDSASVVTYLKDSDLYQYVLKTDSKDKIASDVEAFVVSDDGKKIGYMNEENSIYLYNGTDKEKIVSEITSLLHFSEDLKTVYYTKDDAVYRQIVGKDREKIASDVDSVIQVYDNGTMYYLKSNESEITLWDYIDDDLASSDAAMEEPVAPDYPDVEYPYWWEYDTDAEYEAAQDAYDAAWDQYYEDYDAYDVALELWWDKEDRDELRDSLKESTLSKSMYTLCFYDGKEEKVITDAYANDYWSCDYAQDAAVIVYESYNQEDVSKVKLSDIDYVWDVQYMIDDALFSQTVYYIAVEANATEVEQDDINYININDNGTVIYYFADIDEEDNHGDLYRATVSKGKVQKAELYDSDVYASYAARFVDDDKFLYYKDCSDYTGELYINKSKIDYDVRLYSVYYVDSDKIYYFTDWNEDKAYGTLKVYANGKATKIGDDISDFEILPDGRVLYLYDYSTKYYKGELYVWKDGKATKIDEDVICIIPVVDSQYRGTSYSY